MDETKQEKEPIDWIKKLVEISAHQLIEQSKVPVMLDSMDKNLHNMDNDIKAMHSDIQKMHHDLEKSLTTGFNNLDKNLITAFNDLKSTMEHNTNDLKSTMEHNTNDLKSAMEHNTNELKSKLDNINGELSQVSKGLNTVVEKYDEFGEMMKSIQISIKEIQNTNKYLIAINIGMLGVLVSILLAIVFK